MLQNIAVIALLVVPVLAWGNTARLLSRAGYKWWLQHPAGVIVWFFTALSTMLVTGGTGAFDGSPVPALSFIGGLLIFPVLYAFYWLSRLPHKPAAFAHPSKKTTQPTNPAFVPLTEKQRKSLPKEKPLPPREPERTLRPKPKPVPASPSRAIREGWSMGEIAFTYEDSAGDITSRTVTVHSVTSTYIKGECHDRQAERTFRVDRIVGDIVDMETGELMRPAKWARVNR